MDMGFHSGMIYMKLASCEPHLKGGQSYIRLSNALPVALVHQPQSAC
jgi:hypothetical protein